MGRSMVGVFTYERKYVFPHFSSPSNKTWTLSGSMSMMPLVLRILDALMSRLSGS